LFIKLASWQIYSSKWIVGFLLCFHSLKVERMMPPRRAGGGSKGLQATAGAELAWGNGDPQECSQAGIWEIQERTLSSSLYPCGEKKERKDPGIAKMKMEKKPISKKKKI
jgi:hypothetical protein